MRIARALVFAATLGLAPAWAQTGGSHAEVCFAQPLNVLLPDLARAGLALDHPHTHKTPAGSETCAVLNPAEQARLAQRGIAHRLAVPDLEAAYAAQLPQRRALLQAMR
ncbi:MAG: hypothetical protein AAGF99_15165, partial [Bacteroidota bacterium]